MESTWALVVDPQKLLALGGRRLDELEVRASRARPWPPRSQPDAGRSPGGRRCRARTNSDDGRRFPRPQHSRFSAPMTPDDLLDVVVVGGGAAGLYSALTAAEAGARVAMVSRKPLSESSSFWAQGGLAAAIGSDDSPELHVEDTLAAGRQRVPAIGGRAPGARGARRGGRAGAPRGRVRPRSGRQPVPRARGRALTPAGGARGWRRHRAPDHRASRRARGRGRADRRDRADLRRGSVERTGGAATAC